MNSSRGDSAWRLAYAVVDILNPLLIISLALFVSVGYVLTLLIPVNIDVWAALLVLSLLLPCIVLSWRQRMRWKSTRQAPKPSSFRVLLTILPLLLLLPAIAVYLTRPSLIAIPHINIYLVYGQQIFHGASPPENIFMPGFAATHYWLFHAYIAALVKVTAVDIYSAAVLINAFYIFGSLYWIGRALVALKLAEAGSLWLGFAIMFVFGALNLSGVLALLANEVAGRESSHLILLMRLDGADTRLVSVFPKMFHFSGMTPAMMAFTATLFVCIRMLKGKVDFFGLVLVSASGIVVLGAMPIVVPFFTFALVGGLTIAVLVRNSLLTSRIERAGAFARKLSNEISPYALALWLGISMTLALPLVKYALDLSENTRSLQTVSLFNETNLRMILNAHLLLLPFFLAHAVNAFRRRRVEHLFVLFSGLIGLTIALVISLPDQNQYKFHFFLSMILALSALIALRELAIRGPRNWKHLGRSMLIALVGLTVCNAILVNAYYIDTRLGMYSKENYRFKGDGIHINKVIDKGRRLAAYDWIRENTTIEALVLTPHTYTSDVSLFHERLHYVRDDKWADQYVSSLPLHEARVRELHIFYDSTTTMDDYAALLKSMASQLPRRPFYAVVNDSEVSREIMNERGAEIVYESRESGSHVYLLNPR